jgi:hypothetical protein
MIDVLKERYNAASSCADFFFTFLDKPYVKPLTTVYFFIFGSYAIRLGYSLMKICRYKGR